MGNKPCPKCKKTILLTGRVFRKCKDKKCGYKERKGKAPMVRETKITKTKEGVLKVENGIPELEEEHKKKKFIPSKMTEKEAEDLWKRNEILKQQRRRASIEKMLKRMRKDKYGLKKGTKINIGGELYEL